MAAQCCLVGVLRAAAVYCMGSWLMGCCSWRVTQACAAFKLAKEGEVGVLCNRTLSFVDTRMGARLTHEHGLQVVAVKALGAAMQPVWWESGRKHCVWSHSRPWDRLGGTNDCSISNETTKVLKVLRCYRNRFLLGVMTKNHVI